MKIMVRYLFIFTFLFSLISCEKEEKPLPKQKPQVQATVRLQKNGEHVLKKVDDILQNLIRFPFEKKFVESKLELVLQNPTPFSKTLLEHFLLETVPLFEVDENLKEVKVQAKGEGGTVFLASLQKNDAVYYLKKKISEPELLRRLDIKEVETVSSLKLKVKASRDKPAECETYLIQWLELEPENEVVMQILGNVYRDQNKYPEAIKIYQKIIEKNPASLFAVHNLGIVLLSMGDYAGAVEALKKASTLKPGDTEILLALVQGLSKNGEDKEALKIITQLKKEKKTNAKLFLLEGNILRNSKKYDEALKVYTAGQKASPNDFRFLFNKVLVLLDMKKWDEAKEAYQELREKSPDLARELEIVSVFKEEEKSNEE